MTPPRSVRVAGVELPLAHDSYRAEFGVFLLTVDGGRESTAWSWSLVEVTDASHGRGVLRSMGSWPTPTEAAENAERVIGLFASLPRGA